MDLLVFGSVAIFIICLIVGNIYANKKAKENIENEKVELKHRSFTPVQFATYRSRNKNRGRTEISGVYILHNTSKDKYYIGQSVKVYQRVAAHFAGRGNGDVYADYKYGDKWKIQLIGLNQSKFESLDALEKHYIQIFDACNNGYNKTRGNS